MKYILTANQKESKEKLGLTFKTKTKRKSKLIKLIRKKLEQGQQIHPDELENVYIGKLNKHTQI